MSALRVAFTVLCCAGIAAATWGLNRISEDAATLTHPNAPVSAHGTQTILLAGANLPWMWGPYQQQMGFLATYFVGRGHTVHWMLNAGDMPKLKGATPRQAAALLKAVSPSAAQEEQFAQVRWLSVATQLSMSAINRVVDRDRVDAVIVLKDVGQLVPDEPLRAAVSMLWFPKHFQQLDPTTRMSLSLFTHIVALSPSDASVITADAELTPSRLNISFVPHVISVPDEIASTVRSESHRLTAKRRLRQKFGVPQDAFVVVVSNANYEGNNRKSFDTSLLAFKALRDRVPEAFLYLHAVPHSAIMQASEANPDQAQASRPPQRGIALDKIIYHVGLSEGCYVWDERVLPYAEAMELLLLADVKLQPSKAEGFGMAVLEAQALGTPVVTTHFGAMGDFTKHGVAVPPLQQPLWMGSGFVAIPDLQGVVDALLTVHSGLPPGSCESAQRWVAEEMSAEAVGGKFDALITNGLSVLPPRPQPFNGKVHWPRPHLSAGGSGVESKAEGPRQKKTRALDHCLHVYDKKGSSNCGQLLSKCCDSDTLIRRVVQDNCRKTCCAQTCEPLPTPHRRDPTVGKNEL